MRGVLFGVLGGACALTALYIYSLSTPPAVAFEAAVGVPGPHDQRSRSPGLAMDLAFNGDDSRIIVRQENGEVVSWEVSTGAPDRLGETKSAYAYCPAQEMLATSDDAGVVLTALNDGATQRISGTVGDYAAMNADCSMLALANESEARVRVWGLKPPRRYIEAETRKPVRNGLAISPNGARLAAATGSYDDAAGHDADIETFLIPPWGAATTGPVMGGDLIVGIWRIAYSPDGAALFAGSQSDAKSGLRAYSNAEGAPFWGYDGFASYWVRGLAISPTGEILATGDEKGMLRLWNARTGAPLYEGATGLVIQSLAFSNDGSNLAVGLWDATIGILSVSALLESGAGS